MGILNRFRREQRAQTMEAEKSLLRALLGRETITREKAMQIPTVSGGIDLIANIVAGTPIRLYRDENGRAREIKDDARVRLLNDETGDTLNASEFWRAMIRDYYVGKGAYAYIHREKGAAAGLYYVDERRVSIQKNADPIFKEFKIMVNGETYPPYDFLKILRNTRDGAVGTPITEENSLLLETAYQSLLFEDYLVKKGGNKKGFLQSERRLGRAEMDELKAAFNSLYSSNSDNAIVLNSGVTFKESSNTAAEMQLNQNKLANAGEFAKLFHISADAMAGREKDTASLAKLAAVPLMKVIECALNKDFLLEKEKGKLYWAFDTKQLLKGDMQSRFAAYRTALDANFMQIDEVRYEEDLPPLGLNWVKLGLQDVLYDPKTKVIYTPNTDRMETMGEGRPVALTYGRADDMLDLEKRAGGNPYHDSRGRFTSGGRGAAGKTKYSPSPRRNNSGITVTPKKYGQLCGILNTRYPNAEEGERHKITDATHQYSVIADGFGGMIIDKKVKIK